MKRSLIFAAVIAFMLTACGREEAPKTEAPPPPPAAATPPPATPPADKPAGAAEAPKDPAKPEEKKQ
ncbi:MAG: hypothetical protein ACREV9_13200 [Burkholderiales bacterium]